MLGPATNGLRHGTLTVTVSYFYGAVPDHLSIVFYLYAPENLKPDGPAWPPTHPVAFGGLAVDVPTPAPGATKSYTFAFSQPVSSTDAGFRTELHGSTTLNAWLSGANPYNSDVIVTVRTTG